VISLYLSERWRKRGVLEVIPKKSLLFLFSSLILWLVTHNVIPAAILRYRAGIYDEKPSKAVGNPDFPRGKCLVSNHKSLRTHECGRVIGHLTFHFPTRTSVSDHYPTCLFYFSGLYDLNVTGPVRPMGNKKVLSHSKARSDPEIKESKSLD